MQLITLTTATEVDEEVDRAFANNPTFLAQNVGEWWNKEQFVQGSWPDKISGSEKRLGLITQGRTDYLNKFFPSEVPDGTSQSEPNKAQKRAKDKLVTQLDKTIEKVKGLVKKKCNANEKSETDAERRKRRSTGTPWKLNTKDGNLKAMESLFYQYAYYTRNELKTKCPNQAIRILKRIDRIRLLWFWATCHRDIDPAGAHCSWVTKDHPRLSNFQGKFGQKDENVLDITGCTNENKGAYVHCPADIGGTIKVVESYYGRRNKAECTEGSPTGIIERCWGDSKENITDKAAKACDGKEKCWFGKTYRNEDICPGVEKYVRVSYQCVKDD